MFDKRSMLSDLVQLILGGAIKENNLEEFSEEFENIVLGFVKQFKRQNP